MLEKFIYCQRQSVKFGAPCRIDANQIFIIHKYDAMHEILYINFHQSTDFLNYTS